MIVRPKAKQVQSDQMVRRRLRLRTQRSRCARTQLRLHEPGHYALSACVPHPSSATPEVPCHELPVVTSMLEHVSETRCSAPCLDVNVKVVAAQSE